MGYFVATIGLERRFREMKWRTKIFGVFLSPESAEDLSLAVVLRDSEGWASRRCLDMEPLHILSHQPTAVSGVILHIGGDILK